MSPHANSLEHLMKICDLPTEELVDQGLIQNWILIEIKPLTKIQCRELIAKFLGNYSKDLRVELIDQILNFPLSSNPLFIRTLLEELRLFGSHKELSERLNTLLTKHSSKGLDKYYTLTDLYKHIFSRIGEDAGKDIVGAALKAIWSSRRGMARDELFSFTGILPVKWAEIDNALDDKLLEIGGLITFSNESIREAVQTLYLPGSEDQRTARQRLAEWLEKQRMTERIFYELVWQWQKSEMWHKLVECPKVRATLSQQENEVLELRFGIKDGKFRSVEEVGHLLGLSPDRVDHLQKKALRKLRHLDRIRKLDGFISLPGMTSDGFATDTDLHGKV
jgi:hypothetical protein